MYKTCLSIALIAVTLSTDLRAGPQVCDDDEGPIVCVRFDNMETTPQNLVDYEFVFAEPQPPTIRLLKGAPTPGGTMYEWRVWSKDAQGAPANIGSITSPGEYDYSVKILNASDGAGALNLGSATLTPAGDHYSAIVNGIIGGDLEDVTLKANAAGTGGELDLTVTGSLEGSVEVETINLLVIDVGQLSGFVAASRLVDSISVDSAVPGHINIGLVQAGAIIAVGSLSGSITISEFESGGTNLLLFGGIDEDGVINIHEMGTGTAIFLGLITGGGPSVDGTVQFWEGISNNCDVRFNAELAGTIDLKNSNIATSGKLRVWGGGAGQIINGGIVHGIVDLGLAQNERVFSGTARFKEASTSGVITINGTGSVTFADTFDGNICGTGISPTGPNHLPENIYMSSIGSQGKACGTVMCGSSSFSADPSGLNKTRFISFSTSDSTERAIGVRLSSLHHVSPPYTGGPSIPFEAFEGQLRYVGEPDEYVESASNGIPFKASRLQCERHDQVWNSVGLLHVTGSAIVPSSQYDVGLLVGDNAACSSLSITTTRWGDVWAPYNPPDTSVQPDVTDVSKLVDKFRNDVNAPIKARALLAGESGYPWGEITPAVLSQEYGYLHISACVDAYKGVPYPYTIASCP